MNPDGSDRQHYCLGSSFSAMEEVKTKVCRKCGKELPLSKEYFREFKSCVDGFAQTCKVCYGNKGYGFTTTHDIIDGNIKCACCGEWFPATADYFYKSKAHKGIARTCIVCLKKRKQGYRHKPKQSPGVAVCSKCGRELPATKVYFRTDSQSPTGLCKTCKECRGFKFGYYVRRKQEIVDGKIYCNGCGRCLPASIEYFSHNKSTYTGFKSRCKECDGQKFGIHKKHIELPTKDGYKICNQCHKELPATLEYFIKAKNKVGLFHICKSCKHDNYLRDRDKISKTHKEYRKNNIDKVKKYTRDRMKERRATEVCFNMAQRIRARLRSLLKKQWGSKRTEELIGCTYQEYKDYLESLFTEGMTWDRFLCGDIHLDHIRPLSSYNLDDEEDFKLACHYKNTQPLWAADNLKKHSHYNGQSHYYKKD